MNVEECPNYKSPKYLVTVFGSICQHCFYEPTQEVKRWDTFTASEQRETESHKGVADND